jgi:hypothetical protein
MHIESVMLFVASGPEAGGLFRLAVFRGARRLSPALAFGQTGTIGPLFRSKRPLEVSRKAFVGRQKRTERVDCYTSTSQPSQPI